MRFFSGGGNPTSAQTLFEELLAVMARLRGPDGCPWDREQTLETLRTYLLEETYELLEALQTGDPGRIKEELGDLLLEVVFLARICSEGGMFEMDDVVRGIRDKLVRRHPHVFGANKARDASEAYHRWEEIKRQERGSTSDTSLLAGVPASLPALLRAHRLSTKAGMVGFDWPSLEGLFDKLNEELEEFRQAARNGDSAAMEEELGDLLFIAANIGRHRNVDPELALQRANRKFIDRFGHVEQGLRERGKAPAEATMEEMDALWEEAKKRERS